MADSRSMNETTWYKSSHSIANTTCVEVRPNPNGLDLRDSKDTTVPGFQIGREAWKAFVSGVQE